MMLRQLDPKRHLLLRYFYIAIALPLVVVLLFMIHHFWDLTQQSQMDVNAKTNEINPKRFIASDDCRTGNVFYKGNRLTMDIEGTRDWDICPENCNDPDVFPGFDWNNPKIFSRDQDEVGMCSAFATADYIGKQMKSNNVWPTGEGYNKGVSALDLEIQAFDQENIDKQRNNIDNFLGPKSDDPKGKRNSIYKQADDFVRIAKEVGVCPENAMPSEFRGNGGSHSLRAIYEAFEKHIRQSKIKTEAEVTLIGVCPECNAIAPGLSEQQWGQIGDVIKTVKNLDVDDFNVLKKIDDIACNGKRVKMPAYITFKPISYAEMEIHMANAGSAVILDMHSAYLDPEHIKPKPGDDADYDRHYAVVYGTETRLVNNRIVCFYKIKGSWGPDVCSSVWGGKNSPDIQCVPQDGSYLISKKKLREAMIGAFR